MKNWLIGLIILASNCLIHAEAIPSIPEKTCTSEMNKCPQKYKNENNEHTIAKQKAAKLLNGFYTDFLDTCSKTKTLESNLTLTILEESNIKCAINAVDIDVEKKNM